MSIRSFAHFKLGCIIDRIKIPFTPNVSKQEGTVHYRFPTETENSRRLQVETSDNPIPQDLQTFALTTGRMWFPLV